MIFFPKKSERKNISQKGGGIMAINKTDAYDERDIELDEEMAEVLIAISVISKRLAKKITANLMTKETNDEKVQALRTDGKDRQSET